MSEQEQSEQNSSSSTESSQSQALPPWGLKLEECKTDEDKDKAEKAMNEWLDKFSEDLSDLLTKNGVMAYAVSLSVIGAKTPILLAKGHLYTTAKLAAYAAKMLKNRVDKDLNI